MSSVLQFTPIEQIPKVIDRVRDGFRTGKTKHLSFRVQQLERLKQLLTENEDEILNAVFKDLRKPRMEAYSSEIGLALKEIDYVLDNLATWMQPELIKDPSFIHALEAPQIRREPYGVVLIIGAWNYPVQLVVQTLVAALSAGNAVVIKPSEVAAHTAATLESLLPKYLDNSIIQFVQGGVAETTELLKHRFDKILYTGNGAVGKIILTAAAKHLTPVILELGGKCPAVVASDVDVSATARRIIFGKFFNSGQTCIGVDHVLCHKDVYEEFLKEVSKNVTAFFGENPENSGTLAHIINTNHFDRLKKIIDADKPRSRVIAGGYGNRETLFLAPTVLADVTFEHECMKGEIFGPILPIIKVDSVDQAVEIINETGEKPLALYVFTSNNSVADSVINNTSSGGALVNDVMMHAAVCQLPFGGVGGSGMGAYHGWHGFNEFSHRKSLLVKPQGMEFINDLRYPPMTPFKEKIVRTLYSGRNRSFLDHVPWFRIIVVAVVTTWFYNWQPQLFRSILAKLGLPL